MVAQQAKGQHTMGTIIENADLASLNLKAREFTMTEELDIATGGQHWFVEDDYAAHPIGDRLEAVGDNLYLVTFAECKGAALYDSLRDAINTVLSEQQRQTLKLG